MGEDNSLLVFLDKSYSVKYYNGRLPLTRQVSYQPPYSSTPSVTVREDLLQYRVKQSAESDKVDEIERLELFDGPQ